MPLMEGSSKKAFTKNVKTEQTAHPGRDAQNLAIAYAIKRRNQKAKGGEICSACNMAEGGRCEAHMSEGGLVDMGREREEHRGMVGDEAMDLDMVPEPSTTSGSPTEDVSVRGTHEMSVAERIMQRRKSAQGTDHQGRERDPGIDIHLSEGGSVSIDELNQREKDRRDWLSGDYDIRKAIKEGKEKAEKEDDEEYARGGYVDTSDDDLAPIHDYSELPDDEDASTTGEPHDADGSDEAQFESVVGQIMKKRRLKKG